MNQTFIQQSAFKASPPALTRYLFYLLTYLCIVFPLWKILNFNKQTKKKKQLGMVAQRRRLEDQKFKVGLNHKVMSPKSERYTTLHSVPSTS